MALTLLDLQHRYVAPDGSSVPILHLDRFDLADNEHVALVGASGSGKTTLLNVIAGIVQPNRGRILHRGPDGAEVDLATLPEAARDAYRGRHLGYIFQTHHLLPGFTALENVLLGMSFTGRPADRGWASHLLEEVGLADRAHYRPAKLSVGQQQRVAVARSLANRPSLVLADEPTGSLDADAAGQVLSLIRSLCTEVSASLLLVSHDTAITSAFGRVVRLADLNRRPAGQTAGAQ